MCRAESLEAVVSALQRALRSDHRAVLEHDVRAVGHRLVLHPHVRPGGVAPPVERPPGASAIDDRLARSGEHAGNAAAECAAHAHAVLDEHAERLDAVRPVEHDAGVAAGGVEVPEPKLPSKSPTSSLYLPAAPLCVA